MPISPDADRSKHTQLGANQQKCRQTEPQRFTAHEIMAPRDGRVNDPRCADVSEARSASIDTSTKCGSDPIASSTHGTIAGLHHAASGVGTAASWNDRSHMHEMSTLT
jgi:hypothetical protein